MNIISSFKDKKEDQEYCNLKEIARYDATRQLKSWKKDKKMQDHILITDQSINMFNFWSEKIQQKKID